MDKRELIERYERGERNFAGVNLRRAKLSGANLHGINLHGANLRGANLLGADLSRADLWGANLRGADLREAKLSEANLLWATITGANLRGANLDFTAWPLWCGTFGLGETDNRLVAQLLRHAREAAKACDTEYGREVFDILAAVDRFHDYRPDVEPVISKMNG